MNWDSCSLHFESMWSPPSHNHLRQTRQWRKSETTYCSISHATGAIELDKRSHAMIHNIHHGPPDLMHMAERGIYASHSAFIDSTLAYESDQFNCSSYVCALTKDSWSQPTGNKGMLCRDCCIDLHCFNLLYVFIMIDDDMKNEKR
eukprot:140359_1